MSIETKVQIEAIKTKSYMAGKADGTVMFAEGHYIVYVQEKDCLIDVSKINELPKKCMEEYRAEKVEKLLKPIGLTRKMLIHAGRTVRLFENRETGDRIWFDQKYVKEFKDCRPYLADMGEGYKAIVFKAGGKIIGLVLPVMVSEDTEE